jgi:hypothetical protein
MTTDDTDHLDARVRAALHDLASEATRLRRDRDTVRESLPRSQPQRHRTMAPVIGVAATVAAIAIGLAVVTWSVAGDRDPSAKTGTPLGDASGGSPASPGASDTSATTGITLGAVTGWTVERPDGCAHIRGATDRVVFQLDAFEVGCMTALDRTGTSVFEVPLPERLLGESLLDVTKPWQGSSSTGHELRRLSGGALAELNSVYADAVACMDCARLYIVLGPVPSEVREIVESVRSVG